MKKTTVTIDYFEEKLDAVKLYMEQKELDFTDEMVKAAEALYQKYVPANVREFIDMSDSTKSKPSSRRKQRNTVPDNTISSGESEGDTDVSCEDNAG